MATVKCSTCNGQYGGTICRHCGCAYHIPCKRFPGHLTANRCPACGKMT